jgi:hypothetical protein
MTSFHKGDAVTLDEGACFTTDQPGGLRRYPLINHFYDEKGLILGHRPASGAEVEAWHASDGSRGLDSAGETKLPPRSVAVQLKRGETFKVLRGRARVVLGWGNASAGLVKIERLDGEVAFVKREFLRHF